MITTAGSEMMNAIVQKNHGFDLQLNGICDNMLSVRNNYSWGSQWAISSRACSRAVKPARFAKRQKGLSNSDLSKTVTGTRAKGFTEAACVSNAKKPTIIAFSERTMTGKQPIQKCVSIGWTILKKQGRKGASGPKSQEITTAPRYMQHTAINASVAENQTLYSSPSITSITTGISNGSNFRRAVYTAGSFRETFPIFISSYAGIATQGSDGITAYVLIKKVRRSSRRGVALSRAKHLASCKG